MMKNYGAMETMIGVILLFIILFAVAAVVMMLLWNALMPDIFGLPEISFWQSVGLGLLSSLLIRSTPSISKGGK